MPNVFSADLSEQDRELLSFMLERAAEEGATRALRRLGFDDEHATADIAEMRSLIGAFRDLRRHTRQLFIRWLAYLIVGFVIMVVGSKLGVSLPGLRSTGP